jgi:hypothetical protein
MTPQKKLHALFVKALKVKDLETLMKILSSIYRKYRKFSNSTFKGRPLGNVPAYTFLISRKKQGQFVDFVFKANVPEPQKF